MDERLKTVAHEIARQSGVETFIAPGDVSKESDVERMVGHSAKALGGIDVMIANAGILSEGKELTEYSTEAWKRTFAMNVDGIFFCYNWHEIGRLLQCLLCLEVRRTRINAERRPGAGCPQNHRECLCTRYLSFRPQA
ncbi:hypothetical protein C8R42DRAFT_417051 [Lentinula raphanica]|nr:hypothetical protein C8R42DRAFT_417051 [Lentinula raphanica]